MQPAGYSLKPCERDRPTACMRILARVAGVVPRFAESSGDSFSKVLFCVVILRCQANRIRNFVQELPRLGRAISHGVPGNAQAVRDLIHGVLFGDARHLRTQRDWWALRRVPKVTRDNRANNFLGKRRYIQLRVQITSNLIWQRDLIGNAILIHGGVSPSVRQPQNLHVRISHVVYACEREAVFVLVRGPCSHCVMVIASG